MKLLLSLLSPLGRSVLPLCPRRRSLFLLSSLILNLFLWGGPLARQIQGQEASPTQDTPILLPEAFGSPIRVGLVQFNQRQRLTLSLLQGGVLERVSTQERIKAFTQSIRLTFFTFEKSGIALEGTPYSDPEGFRLLPPPGGGVEIEKSFYPGCVEVLAQPRRVGTQSIASLQVINEVPREDYVAGVLRAEGSPKFPQEANRALSVCIRTYAEYQRGRHKEQGFDLCNTIHCQGYRGLPQGVQPFHRTIARLKQDWASRITASTQGEVLTYEGRLIPTTYSTDCGGLLASNLNAGFGQSFWPFLAVGRDTEGKNDFCEGSPVHHWRLRLSREQLEKILKRSFTQAGQLKDLRLVYETPGGRVQKVQLWGTPPLTDGRNQKANTQGGRGNPGLSTIPKELTSPSPENWILLAELPAYQFRALLGGDTLRSTLFTVKPKEEGEFEFSGQGWGHGVGLCLWGARGMALASPCTYVEILSHYFPKGQLVKDTPQGLVKILSGRTISASQ